MALDEPLYPVNLRVAGQRCLVVGGGPTALEKVQGLLEAGAVVEVVAPEVIPALAALPGVQVQQRRYTAGEVAGYRLVITATGDPEVDGMVHRDGTAAGVWVNSADDPEHCDFTLPARIRRGPLLVTCSTGGVSPAFSTWLRRRLEAELGPEYETLLALVGEARRQAQQAGVRPGQLDWQKALDSGMLEMVRTGQLQRARSLLDELIGGLPPGTPGSTDR